MKSSPYPTVNIIEINWDWDHNIFLTFFNLKAAFDWIIKEEIWKILSRKNIPKNKF